MLSEIRTQIREYFEERGTVVVMKYSQPHVLIVHELHVPTPADFELMEDHACVQRGVPCRSSATSAHISATSFCMDIFSSQASSLCVVAVRSYRFHSPGRAFEVHLVGWFTLQ